jgi:hypothetical protein
VHRDAKTDSSPVRIDAHILIRPQTRMSNAVPDELRYQQPRIVQELRRHRESSEGPSHFDQRFRSSADAEVQLHVRSGLWKGTVPAHHLGLPDRSGIHTSDLIQKDATAIRVG